MKIIDCFYVPAYRHVRNEEDGESYETPCGYNVVAKRDEGDGVVSEFICIGDDGAAYVFDTPEAAQKLVERVQDAGEIHAEKYWLEINRRHVDDLPDYVTDSHRAEFN